MLISHKLKIIFTHIPKTGGGSFREAVRKIDSKVEKLQPYHRKLTKKMRENYPNYRTITIVRNSYKAIASRYKFENVVYKRRNKKLRMNFKQYISKKKLKIFNQLTYIFDKEGYRLTDYILYHNTLNLDILKLNKKLKIKIPLLKHNCHFYGAYNYKQYYTEETKKIVKEKCKKDIEYFNWKFED